MEIKVLTESGGAVRGQLAWATRFDKNGWIRNQSKGRAEKHLDNCLKAGHTRIIALKLGTLGGQLPLI